ncbi:hypothetical protein FO519_006303 [Halicephalobus sp. NKZ332]|nr:hypothetical protein FO519_006303 [Halicephalobus sp. NKZ332]
MLFFAWSLVLSAVNYARKQKLTAILQRHLYSPQAYQTGLICKKIPKKIFGQYLAVESELHPGPSSSKNNALFRAPSEPLITQASDVILYRTEELEIIAIQKPEALQITDWTLFTQDIKKKSIFIPAHSSRVSFIAVIGLNENYTGSQDDLNKIVPVGNESGNEGDDELHTEVHTGVAPVLISSIANQIAFRRHKPNEVLYETDLDNFYSIVFQWSESALFEFSGRGIVKEIHTVQLPDLALKTENFMSPALPYASTGALTLPPNFRNRRPFTLLEYLYLKDLFGDLFESSNEWRNLNVIQSQMDEYAFYRSDSALNRAISPPESTYSSVRR